MTDINSHRYFVAELLILFLWLEDLVKEGRFQVLANDVVAEHRPQKRAATILCQVGNPREQTIDYRLVFVNGDDLPANHTMVLRGDQPTGNNPVQDFDAIDKVWKQGIAYGYPAYQGHGAYDVIPSKLRLNPFPGPGAYCPPIPDHTPMWQLLYCSVTLVCMEFVLWGLALL